MSILADSLLYIATDIGLFSYDLKGEFQEKFLEGRSISDMIIDREGNLWASTLNDGIFLIRNRNIINYPTTAKHKILDLKDSILFAGAANDLHSISDNKLHRLSIGYKIEQLISKQDVFISLAKDENDQIWLGSQKGLYFLKQNEAHLNFYNKINDILPYQGNLFVASYYSCLKLDSNQMKHHFCSPEGFNNADSILEVSKRIDEHTRVYDKLSICFSNVVNDQFFMGDKEGVYKYSNDEDRFQQILPLKNLIKMKQSAEQNLWLLRKDSGLYFLNTTTKKLRQIELSHKVDNVLYNSLDIDEQGNPWLGSNKGIFKIEALDSAYEVRHYDQKSGLLTNEINDLKIISQDIWLATSKGISYLPQLSLNDSIPPLLFIDSIVAGGSPVSRHEAFTLYDDKNTIAIHYTGISYKDLGELDFKFTLKGKTSIKAYTNKRFLLLTDLAPSDYTLIISALDAYGNESEIKSIPFFVVLSWWKNWKVWLIILLGIMLCTTITIRLFFKKSFKEMYELLKGKIPFLDEPKFITVKSATSGGIEKIPLNKLKYIEAAGDYMEILLSDKKILVRTTLKLLSEELAENDEFIRVHKSYIINLKKVDAFWPDSLEIMEKKIPIARNKRAKIKEYAASL